MRVYKLKDLNDDILKAFPQSDVYVYSSNGHFLKLKEFLELFSVVPDAVKNFYKFDDNTNFNVLITIDNDYEVVARKTLETVLEYVKNTKSHIVNESLKRAIESDKQKFYGIFSEKNLMG